MIPVLINTSIIWVCSLLVYEVVLKRETFHRLNRIFLMLTFIAGVVLPLLPWAPDVQVFVHGDNRAVSAPSIANVTPSVTPATGPVGTVGHHVRNRIAILYYVGLSIAVLALLYDFLRLWLLYRRAEVSRRDGWVIAETGRPHSPFSFLHIIFVCSKDAYTDEEWLMVMQHEQQHHRSRHMLDLAIVQTTSVLLWFHPLVYVYRQKLRLLHEYEVDSMQTQDIRVYGHFLLEQATGLRTLAITHSLNFSPLKNRIHMMTRKSSDLRIRYRYLLLLPMMSCFIWCCTQNREKIAVDIDGRYATRHDVKLTYPPAEAADTLTMTTDSGSKEQVVRFSLDPVPEKLNGTAILQPEQLAAPPQCTSPGSSFGMKYLIEKAGITPTLQKMVDGEYYMAIGNAIVDSSGHVAYYWIILPENHTEFTTGDGGFNEARPSGLSDADEEDIQKKISGVLIGGNVTFSASKDKSGKQVPYFLDSDAGQKAIHLGAIISVKNHQITLKDS